MTIREYAEAIKDAIVVFESGGRLDLQAVTDHAQAIIHELDASAPQCLDDPPNCSHRLVPDRQVLDG